MDISGTLVNIWRERMYEDKKKKKQIQTNITFCLHYPERHPPKNKCGGLWVSKDLKTSLLQNYRKFTRPLLITKRPMVKHKPRKQLRQLSTTLSDTKTQNYFVEKRERTSTTCWNQLRRRQLEIRGTQKHFSCKQRIKGVCWISESKLIKATRKRDWHCVVWWTLQDD